MAVEQPSVTPHEVRCAVEISIPHCWARLLRLVLAGLVTDSPAPTAASASSCRKISVRPNANAAQLAHDRPGRELQQRFDLALDDENRVAADAVLDRDRASTHAHRRRRTSRAHADRDGSR